MGHMIRAVFFDIDGTLLDSSGQVPESALASIGLLHEKGILVGICTGRSPSETKKFVKDHPGLKHDILIYANGALAEYNGRVIIDRPIKKELISKIVEELISKKIPYWLSGKDEWYFSVRDLSEIKHVLINEEWLRTDYYCPDYHIMNDVYMGEYYTGGGHFFTWSISMDGIDVVQGMLEGGQPGPIADFYSYGIDKGTAVLECLSKLKISQSETMAFGDSFNDVPLLQVAGIGVAMGNGSEDLKNIADFITTDIGNDGVQHALIYHGLI